MQGIIIGAGIGGLTTAIALQQRGLLVKVYEKKAVLEPEGAGIVLAINAMRIMDKLGLADEIYRQGNELNGFQITDETLEPLSRNIIPHFVKKYGYSNVAIHRADLQKILLQQLKTETLELGKAATRTVEKDREVKIEFEDGLPAIGDYMIAADGIHSVIRKQLFPEATIRNAKQICWRGIVAAELPAEYRHQAVEAWGKGRRFGFSRLNEDYVYWFAVINRHNNNFDFRSDLKKELEKQFSEFDPLLQELIADTPESRIIRNDLIDIKPLKQWYAGRICLLGDAAHATTPNLGQGACQAVEDARTMASLMDQYKNPVRAFPKFQKIRKSQADYVNKWSYRVGEMAHYENSMLVAFRNQMTKMTPKKFLERRLEKLFREEE